MGAFALGVGQMQVHSALNQVLDAEIPLLLANPAEAASITARLAPAQVFAQNGIDRPALLAGLVFSVQTDADGRHFIKVSSKQAIREPLLNFLIQVDWPKGQVVREFAVLLDPPAKAAKRLTVPAVAQPRQAAAAPPARSPAPSRPAVAHRGTATYGPVPFGETLWNIASRVRPDPAISLQRMMQALLDNNPGAFWKRSVNGLRAGATLRIPSAQEIDATHFSEQVSRQLAERQQVPVAPVAARLAAPRPEGKPQVRLVPPESREGLAATPARQGLTAAPPTLSTLIKLKGNRPELRLASLEEVRQRVSTLEPQEAKTASAQASPAIPQPQAQGQETLARADKPPPPSEPLHSNLAASAALQPDTHLQEVLPETLIPPSEISRQTPAEAGRLSVPPQPPPPPPEVQVPKPTTTPSTIPSQPPVVAPAVTPPLAAVPPAVRPLPAAEETGSGGILGEWLSPFRLSLLSGLALLLGGGSLYWLQRRSKQEESEEALAFEGVTPTATPTAVETTTLPSLANSGKMEPAPGAQPVRAAPNPLERADLLLTVGNHAEAENIVRQALIAEPGNTSLLAKLLDVHFATHNTEAFVKGAEALYGQLQDKSDPLWSQVMRQGRELCPDHALFRDTDQLFTSPLFASTKTLTSPREVGSLGESDRADSAIFARLDELPAPSTEQERDILADLDRRLTGLEQPTLTSAQLPENTLQTAVNEPGSPLPELEQPTVTSAPFDENPVTQTTFKVPDWRLPELKQPSVTIKQPLPDKDKKNTDEEKKSTTPLPLKALDFELDSLFTRETTSSNMPSTPVKGDLEFMLEESEQPLTTSYKGTLAGEDYVETKLDLAMAYLDMGDPDGARSLLEEVLKEGNDSQKQRAKALLVKSG
jgi:pilus assembly protein FimV